MPARNCAPIIKEELNMIARSNGRPVAFMLTFPDVNDAACPGSGAGCFRSAGSPCCAGCRHPKGRRDAW